MKCKVKAVASVQAVERLLNHSRVRLQHLLPRMRVYEKFLYYIVYCDDNQSSVNIKKINKSITMCAVTEQCTNPNH